MENQDIELIKLHEYFRKFNFNSKSFRIKPTSTEVKLPLLKRENASISLNKLWYDWQRNLADLLKMDDNHESQNLISRYTQNDDQFPPDLTKLIRIRKILEMLKPDCILEIGCGTSSLILSSESKKHDIPFLTVDSSREWLDTTKGKAEKAIGSCLDDKLFFHHEDWSQTTGVIKKFFTNKSSIFIYLDAVLDSNLDQHQGLQIIIDSVDNSTGKVTMMVDSRKQAIIKLHYLAERMNRDLLCSTNFVDYSPSQNIRVYVQNHSEAMFLKMSAASLVSSTS